MKFGGVSVLYDMAHFTTIFTTALFALSMGSTALAGAPSLEDAIPAYSRDANGIAMAVTEILPSIDDCVASHQALGGEGEIQMSIAFAVNERGEIAGLSIDGSAATTTLPSCIEGTLSAMRFQQGDRSVNVQLPLIASARTESSLR